MTSTSGFQHGHPGHRREPWTKLTHREILPGWFAYNPRTMRSPPLSSDTKCMKILSWNVNGLRTVVESGGFSAFELAQRENLDVLCLQETHLEACFCVSTSRLFIYNTSYLHFFHGSSVASMRTWSGVIPTTIT